LLKLKSGSHESDQVHPRASPTSGALLNNVTKIFQTPAAAI